MCVEFPNFETDVRDETRRKLPALAMRNKQDWSGTIEEVASDDDTFLYDIPNDTSVH